MDISNMPQAPVATPPPVVAASAPAGGAAPDKPTTAEDFFELMLDGAKEPVKVPVSKLPVDKLNPHLAKLRSDADRRMSEADRRTKELDAKAEKYGTIEKLATEMAKDPSKFFDLGKSLGISQEKLWEMSEAQITARIHKEMQEADEAKNPAAKQAREDKEELTRLRAEKVESDKTKESAETQQIRQGVERLMVSALDKFKPELKQEAAREMSVILRAAFEADKQLTSEELAKAARDALRWRATKFYSADEEDLDDSLLKRAEAILKKRAETKPPPHPSQNPNPGKSGDQPRAKDGKFVKHDAGEVLLGLLHGKRG